MARTQPIRSLAELPCAAACRFGTKTAVIDGSVELSFADIEDRIAACARGLSSLGLGASDRILLHLPNGWSWIVAYYAILRIGAVVVPANILLVAGEIAYMASDCGALAIIAPEDKLAQLKGTQSVDCIRCFISVGGSSAPGCYDFQELIESHRGSSGLADVDGDALSTIGYTSGTTGMPKGALLSHRAILTNTAMTAVMHARNTADVVVTALPCPHVYGNVVMNGAFLAGYTLVLLPRFEEEAVLSSIERFHATLFEGVPTMYYYLLGSEHLPRHDLSSLTRCTVGGQTMTLPQMLEVQARLGCPLLELWGMTEIGGLGTTHPAYMPPRLGSIGQPLPFNECRIADLEAPDRTLPDGEIGELMIRGPTVMRGYHSQPEATREVLRADGWLHTGDLARRDEQGFYFVVDRKKEMIISGGYNIYPSELERVIATHPAVQMVAVGGVPDGLKGEAAHAFIVRKSDASLSENDLREHCRKNLAAYKVPKAFHFVTDLPKTSTGKITRRTLRTLSSETQPT